MSIQSEIERINANIASAYDAVQEKGGDLPKERNSNNLPAAIAGIPAGSDAPSDGAISIAALNNWQEVTLPGTGIDSVYYTRMAYGGGHYVAFSTNQNVLTYIYSDDAKEWKTAALPTSPTRTTIYDVKYIDGRFIAVGSGGTAIFSTDGKVWEQFSGITWTSTYCSIAGGDGKIVILSTSASTGLISLDGGDTWEVNSSSQVSGTQGTQQLAYGNGTFVFKGSASNTLYYSTDGKKWTSKSINCSQFIDFINGQFFGVYGYTNSGFTVITSENGSSWKSSANDWLAGNSSRTIGENIVSAAYGNGMYIMVLSNTFAAAAVQATPMLLNIRNDNLSNWSALAAMPRHAYSSIVFDGKKFTAMSKEGVVAYLEI